MRKSILGVVFSLSILMVTTPAQAAKPVWAGYCFGQAVNLGPNAQTMNLILEIYRALLTGSGGTC